MDPLKKRGGRKPESIIQDRIIKELRYRGWYVNATHGNLYQEGFPDLYAHHFDYGARWIEVKQAVGSSFTVAQMREFPKMAAVNCGVWVLIDSTPEELAKLMKPANWKAFQLAMTIRGLSRGG